MNETNTPLIKQPPARANFAAWYRYYMATGKCRVLVTTNKSSLQSLRISFGGSLAPVPSLKNQKIPNTNILRPRPKAHLTAMTDTFRCAMRDYVPMFSDKAQVACWIEFSKRKVSFDEDNPCSTIKDWLEPQFIRKKDRGWGAGVVKNDSKVFAIPRKKLEHSPGPDWTDIYLCPLSLVEDDIERCGEVIKRAVQSHSDQTYKALKVFG